MGTKHLESKKEKCLQPTYGLWQQYKPDSVPYAFKAKNRREAQKWQHRTRRALAKLIGLNQVKTSALHPKRIELIDKGDYVREKIILNTTEHSKMPVYLLLPKKVEEPIPVVIAFHGHGYGVKDIVGLWENGEERDTPDGYQKDFAIALCREGFAVAAPEISCFGERQTDFGYLDTRIGQPVPTSCTQAAMLSFHLGNSVVGLRVHDGMCLVDYLGTRKDLDVSRLGAMGISSGGMHTFFSTCIDERIKACVISGYYSTFQDSLLAMSHCACNFVPGLAQFGEMYDLVGLISPRPMLIEAGTYDPIFPMRAVKSSVRKAQCVYEVFDAKGMIFTDYFEGRHQISGQKAYAFLRTHLAQDNVSEEGHK